VFDVIVAGIAVFLLTWAGSTLLLDAWVRRRRRPTLTERLLPYQPSVADEAEWWLHRHRG
jgi:hypothetical protein